MNPHRLKDIIDWYTCTLLFQGYCAVLLDVSRWSFFLVVVVVVVLHYVLANSN